MRKGKIVGVILCALTINCAIAQAYSGSFSFEIYDNITGSTKHSLEAVTTSCSATANTYHATEGGTTTKDSYTVSLVETGLFGKTYTSVSMKADNVNRSHSYGKISKGTYNVSVVNKNSNAAAAGRYIKGSGTINQ